MFAVAILFVKTGNHYFFFMPLRIRLRSCRKSFRKSHRAAVVSICYSSDGTCERQPLGAPEDSEDLVLYFSSFGLPLVLYRNPFPVVLSDRERIVWVTNCSPVFLGETEARDFYVKITKCDVLRANLQIHTVL